MELSGLNARFAIQDVLVFKQGPGGLVVAEVENEAASARIALQGAQLMRWTPGAEQPVIWLSEAAAFEPGKSIRGGVPEAAGNVDLEIELVENIGAGEELIHRSILDKS